MPAQRLKGREAEVIAGYEAGASVDELADRFGVSNSQIRRILIAAGVERRPTGRTPATKPDLEHLAAAYRAGESQLSLARLHEVNTKTVRRWLIEAGVDIDPLRRRSRRLGGRLPAEPGTVDYPHE